MTKQEKRSIANYLRMAASDLEEAEYLAKKPGSRNPPYLYSQAAEKIVKAVLISEGEHAGREHRIFELLKQIPDKNPLKILLKETDELSDYSTTYRYPTPTGRIKDIPSSEELEPHVKSLKKALEEMKVIYYL